MPGHSFGRPAFGKAKFGSASSSAPSTEIAQTGQPAFASSKIDLTDEEKKMRDALAVAYAKKQQVPVEIYAGRGPQHTRGGRVDPEEQRIRDVNEAITARGRAFYKAHYGRDIPKDWFSPPLPKSSRYTESQGFTIRRSKVDAGVPSPSSDGQKVWGSLRKRGELHQASAKNGPSEGEKDTEWQAKSRQFTPLFSGAPRPPPRFNFTGPQQVSGQKQDAQERQSGRHEGSRQITLPRRDQYQKGRSTTPHLQRESRSQTTSYTRHTEARTSAATTHEDLSFEARQKLYDQAEQQPRSHSSVSKSKAPGRFGKSTYEDVPRGKDRDKARRRQQFGTREDEGDEEDRAARAAEKLLRKKARAEAKKVALTPIILPAYISVSNLASALKTKYEDFAKKLEELGFRDFTPDLILNGEDAGLIAGEYKYEPLIDRGEEADLKPRPPHEDFSTLPPRPPVVTIMGHVDHGKTTLLDYLRKSSVAATEHGGITQHIGAFSVPMPSGKIITFLDTPGHAAFLNMRQRGANVTDIVILVVAADDSVKPQTIEAINHAKAARVPIVVAINKVDKEDANIEKVKQDLARHGVEIEDYGGDTQVVAVSGKTGLGMNELEETIVTLSEVIDMRAETVGSAEGWVLEASVKSMGKVATVLVRRGTMRPGDVIVAGNTWARIRCLRNEAGVEIDFATPGMPVEIDGWKEQPLAGDEVLQAESEGQAKDVVDYRLEKIERDRLAEDMEAINETRKTEQAKRAEEKRMKALNDEEKRAEDEAAEGVEKIAGVTQVYFIIKGDVSGSVEAVIDSISAVGNAEVTANILRTGVGQLSEFDVEHAAAAQGILINFNTSIDPNIVGLAERAKVPILDHNVIYRLVDDVKAKMSEYLPPLITQRVLGEAEVAQVFEITVKGRQVKNVAGVKVRNGVIAKTAKIRVLRDGKKIFDGMFCAFFPDPFTYTTQVLCLPLKT